MNQRGKKKNELKEMKNPRVSRRKEILKIRAENYRESTGTKLITNTRKRKLKI